MKINRDLFCILLDLHYLCTMNYTIEKITTLIGARRVGTADAQIGWLLTDSRSLCFPEETLFFALKTARNDGHRYIDDLYRRGVRNFVVTAVPTGSTAGLYADANFLVVPSPLAALQRLAERHRDEFDIPIVGLTGSNGKTMVKEWLYQLLSPQFAVTRSPKSFNSQIGVPLSVWLLNRWVRWRLCATSSSPLSVCSRRWALPIKRISAHSRRNVWRRCGSSKMPRS